MRRVRYRRLRALCGCAGNHAAYLFACSLTAMIILKINGALTSEQSRRAISIAFIPQIISSVGIVVLGAAALIAALRLSPA